MAERLARVGFNIENMRFEDVDNLWARRGTESPVFVLLGIPMLFQLDSWMHGIQTRFCLASVMVNCMAVVLPT
jgi:acyl-ACP thioesterase